MNGPLSMYKLKPVVHFANPIDISQTMYSMKNIYSSNIIQAEAHGEISVFPTVLEQVNKLLKKPSSEIEDLKKRQEDILIQLNYLKQQMLALREELSKKNSTNDLSTEINKSGLNPNPSYQRVVIEPSWTGIIGEIVVHASPEYPPYSLLAVNQIWPEILRLRTSCHSHSSIPTYPPHLSVFSSLADTISPSLHIRIIWKNMDPDCEMVISPLNHCPIRGEVNLLRYLHRTICTSNDLVTEMKLDNILDVCHRLIHARTVSDKRLLIRTLNARLGKATWLGGDAMSVADVAAWSAVRNTPGVELSQNMTRWQSRCSVAAGVEAA